MWTSATPALALGSGQSDQKVGWSTEDWSVAGSHQSPPPCPLLYTLAPSHSHPAPSTCLPLPTSSSLSIQSTVMFGLKIHCRVIHPELTAKSTFASSFTVILIMLIVVDILSQSYCIHRMLYLVVVGFADRISMTCICQMICLFDMPHWYLSTAAPAPSTQSPQGPLSGLERRQIHKTLLSAQTSEVSGWLFLPRKQQLLKRKN